MLKSPAARVPTGKPSPANSTGSLKWASSSNAAGCCGSMIWRGWRLSFKTRAANSNQPVGVATALARSRGMRPATRLRATSTLRQKLTFAASNRDVRFVPEAALLLAAAGALSYGALWTTLDLCPHFVRRFDVFR